MGMKDPNDYSDLLDVDLPFDITKVRSECIKCVRRQVEKFKNNVDENKKSLAGRFIVPCEGIMKDPIDPRLKHVLSPEEWEQAQVVLDPVKWAAKYVTHPDDKAWIARDYQEEVMRCTSKRRALRISRRCLVADTPVLMKDGTWRPIQDVKKGEYVASRKLSNAKVVCKKVLYEHDNGVKDVYRITLSDGRSIECTANHPLLINQTMSDGRGMKRVWKTIDNGLSKGDKIVTLKEYNTWGEKSNPSLGKLMGYMLTDGYFGKEGQTPKFTNNNEAMIAEVKTLVKELFDYDCSIREKGNGYDVHITDSNKVYRNKFTTLIKDFGLRGTKAQRKKLPEELFKYDKETLLALINRMFSGDGCVSVSTKKNKRKNGSIALHSRPEVVLVSASKEMLDQIRLILLKINVIGNIRKEERITNRSNGKLSVLYRLVITDSNSVKEFFKNVGYIYGKEEASKKALEVAESVKFTRKQGTKNWKTVTIRSIEHQGKKHTYDIEVDGTHNFITNSIVSHNTGKTDVVSVEICYHMFTKKGQRILVAAPQKVHVEEIIERIRGFLQRNGILYNEVVRDVSSPFYEILLSNGSRVRGFALGTRGKSEGVAVRGQNADRIYCDEMDYADDKAIIGGLFPILQTTPDTAMTGFSTPTGFKSTYYSICEEVPSYREFFYNYKVLPHWRTVEKDRPQYTDDEWTHEMLAEWGTAEAGVYKPSYVDRSLRSYQYEEMRPAAGWRYTMGVDWNEKHGAEFVVVGENISGGFYQIVHASVVEKSEFTQLVSVQGLISLYKTWNPVAIYVDAGNGSTNYELIRKMSYDQRKPGGDPKIAKLLDLVKRYDSGASIETIDPVTSEKRKVPAKPYMVNSAVRAFEQDKMRISSADKVLEKQIRNYVIDRISPTGTPVYAMRDQKVQDHRLDAFNLAMVAFFREFGGLQQNNIITDAVATVNPITKQFKSNDREERADPSERRLEKPKTILSGLTPYLPAHVGRAGQKPISGVNTGAEYDMESQYHQMYLQRQRRRSRVNTGNNTIKRTNI